MKLKAIEYKGGYLFVDETRFAKEFGDIVYNEFTKGPAIATGVVTPHGNLIVAQSPELSIKGIPYVALKEDVEKLGRDRAIDRRWDPDSMDTKRVANEIIEAVKYGYEVASPKQFTAEDMVNFLEWLKPKLGYNQDTGKFHVDVKGTGETSNEKISSKSIVDNYVQSVKRKIASIELELLLHYNRLDYDDADGPTSVQTKTYEKDGAIFLRVKQINYEK